MEDNFDFLNNNDDVKDIDLGLDDVSADVSDMSLPKDESIEKSSTAEEFDLDEILGKKDQNTDDFDFSDAENENFFWEKDGLEKNSNNNDFAEIDNINEEYLPETDISYNVSSENDVLNVDDRANETEPDDELEFEHDIIKENSDENINLSPDDKNERKAESDIDYSDEEIKDKSNEDKEAETDNIVPLKQELPQQPYDIVENANFVRWYSGNSNEVLFEITKDTESSIISGSDECRLIHVNVGYDTYGWLVEFDNGIYMSLPDVKIYQLRNGALPSQNGVITYGANRFEFSGIERIVVYESVRYFSYGV